MTRRFTHHATASHHIARAAAVIAGAALLVVAVGPAPLRSTAHAGIGIVGCDPTPELGCRPPEAGSRSLLRIKNRVADTRDMLVWKYLGGAATPKSDFGDPVNGGTDFAFCIYDSSGLVSSALIPGSSFCVDRPCWRDRVAGFRFRDPPGSASGIVRMTLQAGAAGETEIILRAQGEGVDVPPMPLSSPVTVQLLSSEGVCWEASYSTPERSNTAARYEDRAD